MDSKQAQRLVTELARFRFRVRSFNVLHDILAYECTTLESLSISDIQITDLLTSSILELCCGLRKLSLFWEQQGVSIALLPKPLTRCPVTGQNCFPSVGLEGFEAIELTCKVLGTRLVEMKIEAGIMGKEALVRIVNACPKASIDIPQCCFGTSSIEAVLALGLAASSWTMSNADNDSRIFARIGLSCPYLRRISMRTSCDMFSESSFGALFTPPKPALRHFNVYFPGDSASRISSVLNVLSERHNSLTSFSCSGSTIALAPLRRFLQSHKELKKIQFHAIGWCSCQSHHYPSRSKHLQDAHKNDMGLYWKPIVSVCIENTSLVEITCKCSCVGGSSRQTASDFSGAFPAARGLNLSINVCRSKIQ